MSVAPPLRIGKVEQNVIMIDRDIGYGNVDASGASGIIFLAPCEQQRREGEQG